MAEFEGVPVEVSATDGVRLGGREYQPTGVEPFVALMLPGIGVPQRAFRHLGGFLAEQGVRAFSIDYRGMGDSRSSAASATLRNWAECDAVGALRFAEERWGKPVVLFAHSFGGQVVGLADDFSRLRSCVFIASQFGQAKYWDGIERVKVAAFWRVILPVASSVFETVPGWTGAGEALPRGVAREWARWGRSPDWYLTHVAGARQRLALFSSPILAYAVSDDPIAPRRAVSALLDRFETARVVRREVEPIDLGVAAIGHLGLLRPMAKTLWRDMLDFSAREVSARSAA
jgi:predicted alpha/beta hydrolase